MNPLSNHSTIIPLQVYIRRSANEEEETNQETGMAAGRQSHHVLTIRKSKLLMVDLAGSERIGKSGFPFTTRSSIISFLLLHLVTGLKKISSLS